LTKTSIVYPDVCRGTSSQRRKNCQKSRSEKDVRRNRAKKPVKMLCPRQKEKKDREGARKLRNERDRRKRAQKNQSSFGPEKVQGLGKRTLKEKTLKSCTSLRLTSSPNQKVKRDKGRERSRGEKSI